MTDTTEATGNGTGPQKETSQPADLEALLKERDSKYAYLYADFENFKKRVQREREELLKYGVASFARDILSCMDNLERAVIHAPQGTPSAVVDGIRLVLQQMTTTLAAKGIQPIETQGKVFDPHFHEAVAHEDSAEPAGKILKEEMRGYTLHGRLLRPSRVVVSKGELTPSA